MSQGSVDIMCWRRREDETEGYVGIGPVVVCVSWR